MLGVTVERLAVQAGASSSQELQRDTPRMAVDPWLTAQIGTRLALHPRFWLSARMGADLFVISFGAEQTPERKEDSPGCARSR